MGRLGRRALARHGRKLGSELRPAGARRPHPTGAPETPLALGRPPSGTGCATRARARRLAARAGHEALAPAAHPGLACCGWVGGGLLLAPPKVHRRRPPPAVSIRRSPLRSPRTGRSAAVALPPAPLAAPTAGAQQQDSRSSDVVA